MGVLCSCLVARSYWHLIPNVSPPFLPCSLPQDLEGQIMALDERWTVLCTWNERRWDALQEVLSLWRGFEGERLRMSRWLDAAEESCRNMERSPTEETNQLLLQATEIMVGRRKLKASREYSIMMTVSCFITLFFGFFCLRESRRRESGRHLFKYLAKSHFFGFPL